MKLALIQMSKSEDSGQNLKMAVEVIGQAASNGADMAVLPEMFLCPYKASKFPFYAQESGGSNWKALSQAARDNHIYLVAGSMPELEISRDCCQHVERIYNTSYVFDPNGKEIARHRKVHLFDCDLPQVRFHESDSLSAGCRITVFDTEFGRVGLMICFDIRFPEMARLMADMGAGLIIVPAAFNMTSGPKWWDLMFRSRAVDNQLYMAGCSPARDQSASYVAWGHSLVADPTGEILAGLDEKPGILYQDINLESVEKFRKENRIYLARRNDLYTLKS